MSLYADIILPLPLNSLFTYEVPSSMKDSVKEGVRAVVHFGTKKYYTGIVARTYESAPKENIKPIESILEDYPIVLPAQLRLWEWISTYYMCPVGDVYKAAVPASFKLESKTFVYLNESCELQERLTENEQKIFQALSPTKPITIAELEKATKIGNVVPYIKSLTDKGIAFLSEDVKNTYVAKTESAVRLAKDYSEEELTQILDGLTRAKKQHELLLVYLGMLENKTIITRKELLTNANISTSILSELIKKNILSVYDLQISRFNYGETNLDAANTLNTHQEKAYREIKESFLTKDASLLFGVTSSGKTEIYIQLIKDVIAEGKQVLYLLPEIALTTQITDRLKQVFGSKLAVYHSKFNDNERVDIWNQLLKNDVQIVLGARSAVLLPFSNLGLVIVDEEHEGSYKQQDPAPRYNARNTAIVLANMYGAKTLLGTATPSIETYHNALTGRYGLIRLTQRHKDIELPTISVVNTKELRRIKQMKSVLSPPLIQGMQEALSKGEQIILFQNRRGFSSMLECKTCSWTPYCEHCDVSLTYHKQQNVMVCHYCGATYSVPAQCPDCETPTLDVIGYGTERVEEEVNEQFPEVMTARMDMDTTRGKRSYERLISDFELGKTQILIGTQMVSKGLDFENVSVVGILNADNQLNYPDFRAHEKAFQLMVQVSGRAGRKHKQGTVFLQTSHPGHPIISFVKNADYESFFQLQANERKLFRYPPYFRLIEITLKARHENIVDGAARWIGESLKQSFGERVLGPTKPPIARIQSLHLRKILLKVEHSASIAQVREALIHYQASISNNPNYKSVFIQYDVDPM